MCGNIPYDSLIQRYLPKCYIHKHCQDRACEKVYSSRPDYIRDEIDDYVMLLLNPSWKVTPSIAFIDGKGPTVLTCREHHGGSKKAYIHPPRQPHHVIPSKSGDQLCHAVMNPRLIKPMKASKYCNTYQMHEQRGSFQGIDTCTMTTFRDFSFCSRLLDESESRSIKYRADINCLLGNLEKEGYISSLQVDGMRKRAMEACPSDDVMKRCLSGATYVTLEDAMSLQHEVGQDKTLKVTCDHSNPTNPVVLQTKRNWIQSIVYCQTMDSYGARFSVIPTFSLLTTETRIIWTLSGMLVCVKELWNRTDNCEIKVSRWHGWLLAYLSKKCFPGVRINSDTNNPIQSKFVLNIPRLIQKMNVEITDQFNLERLEHMFVDHENVAVLYNSDCSNQQCIEEQVSEGDDIIIVIYDVVDLDYVLQEEMVVNGVGYELRFVSTTESLDGELKWNGNIYSRHGGNMYPSWWFMNRRSKFFLQMDDDGVHQVNKMDLDVSVYVARLNTDIECVRNQFMKYIGGQCNVQCYEHKLPFIVSNDTSDRCYQISDGEGNICGRKVSFMCPNLGCTSGMCKKCLEALTSEEIQFIFPPDRNVQHVSVDEQSKSSESNDGDDHTHDLDDECLDHLVPQEEDDIDDFVIDGGNDEIPYQEVVSEFFPTTLAGNTAYIVEEDAPSFHNVDGHVIMNQCGGIF